MFVRRTIIEQALTPAARKTRSEGSVSTAPVCCGHAMAGIKRDFTGLTVTPANGMSIASTFISQ
jgi:hypothetical protein